MAANELSGELSCYHCNCKDRKKNIEDTLFGPNGYVDWEFFRIIGQCGEDDMVLHVINRLKEKGIFDEKEGYALYQENGMINPIERLGENIYFTDEKYARDFSEAMKLDNVVVRHIHSALEDPAPLPDYSVSLFKKFLAKLKI